MLPGLLLILADQPGSLGLLLLLLLLLIPGSPGCRGWIDRWG